MENLFIINLLIIFICFIFTFYINNRVLLIIILILGHDMIKIENEVITILIYMDIYINYFILAFFITIFFVLAHNKKTIEMFVYSYFLCIGSFILPGINFGLHLGRNLYIYGIYYNDSK